MRSAIASWPTGLPMALRNGHGYEDQDTRSVTEMTQGPPRFRGNYQNAPRTYNIELQLTQPELALYEHHYNFTLAGGTKPTYIPVLDEKGFRTVAVMFLQKGSPRIKGGSNFGLSAKVITYDH